MSTSADPEIALSLEGVCKRFGPIRVLEGVDLAFHRGERHALIGPNGAGKSTLFNLMSGHLQVTSGHIKLGTQSIAGVAPHRLNRAGLSRSFQITAIFEHLSVRDNIRLAVMSQLGERWALWRRASAWRDIEQKTDAIMAGAHLYDSAELEACTLAYSDQRALEICMTIATGAQVILLDEPTAGMSRDETARMVSFIRRVSEGRTLLMVEHDMDVVFGLADRISVLAGGKIIATGTPDQIRHDERVQQAYLGPSTEDAA
jgi:branched-chain amino acid transport system ATP-binding protein